jgi:hypothetical protein
LEEPLALEESVKFTPPIIVADEEVAECDNSRTETLGDKSIVNKKKIIKDGNVSVKNNDINPSKKGIDDLLKKLNAYYKNEDLQNHNL